MNHQNYSTFFAFGPVLQGSRTQNTEDLAKDPGLSPSLRNGSPVGDITDQAAPADRSSQFVAVTGSEAEQTNANTLVVAAYGLFWLFTFVLVWVTFRGQQRLKSRMTDLERRLAKDVAAP